MKRCMILIALTLLLAGCGGPTTPAPDLEATHAAALLTPGTRAREVAADALPEFGRNPPMLTGFTESADEITVQWALGEEDIRSLLLISARRDVLTMAQALWEAGYNSQTYVFSGTYRTVEFQGGQVYEDQVILVILHPDTTGRIVWDGFSTDDLPTIADTYWQHPDFTP